MKLFKNIKEQIDLAAGRAAYRLNKNGLVSNLVSQAVANDGTWAREYRDAHLNGQLGVRNGFLFFLSEEKGAFAGVDPDGRIILGKELRDLGSKVFDVVLMHEIGHFVLGHQEHSLESIVERNLERAFFGRETEEFEADAFAALFCGKDATVYMLETLKALVETNSSAKEIDKRIKSLDNTDFDLVKAEVANRLPILRDRIYTLEREVTDLQDRIALLKRNYMFFGLTQLETDLLKKQAMLDTTKAAVALIA